MKIGIIGLGLIGGSLFKDLKKDYFHWSKNGANYDTPANATAHHTNIKAPEKEPYYTYGLITK